MSATTNTTQLLISVSDPLLFYVRMRNWKNHLEPLCDNMLVAVAPGPHENLVPKENADAIQEFFVDITKNDPKIKLTFLPSAKNNHGENIRFLTQQYWDEINDTVLLMEDDDFIVNHELLATYLNRVRNNEIDIVGSTRGCTNNSDLINFCLQVLQQDNVFENMLPYTFPHFAPTHLIFKKDLISPNEMMEAHGVQPGETLNYRGRTYTYKEYTCMDTFVMASINMLNRARKVCEYFGCFGDTQVVNDFNYYFYFAYYNHNWLPTPNDLALELAKKPLFYHIGSATCLCRFAYHHDDLLQESIFQDMERRITETPDWENNDTCARTILEVYRRLYVYKLFYDLVRNDAAFARFVPAYDANFAIAEEYFSKRIKVKELMAKYKMSLFDPSWYNTAFKQIIGESPL